MRRKSSEHVSIYAAFIQSERDTANAEQSSSLIWEVCRPAGPCRVQQRGQSPHTVAMWLPGGTKGAPAEASHLKKAEKGSVEFLWLMLPNIRPLFTELRCVNQPDLSSRRFIYIQVFPTAPEQSYVQTEMCLLCKCKQSSSFIYIWLSRVLANNIFLIIYHLFKKKCLFVVSCWICVFADQNGSESFLSNKRKPHQALHTIH